MNRGVQSKLSSRPSRHRRTSNVSRLLRCRVRFGIICGFCDVFTLGRCNSGHAGSRS